MANHYFILNRPRHKWGDYGETLVHGHGGIVDGICRIERVGPFIPPITMPGYEIVVSDSVRAELEESGLTGFSFIPVVKAKVVRLDWHQWDWQSSAPAIYPETGEPEDYIDEGDHCEVTAKALGDLWAILVPEIARVERDRPIVESPDELHLLLDTTQGLDLVGSKDVRYHYVSERAKDWLLSRFRPWVQFQEASVRR